MLYRISGCRSVTLGGGGEKQQPEVRVGCLATQVLDKLPGYQSFFFSFAEIEFGGDVSGSAVPTRLRPKAEAVSGEARG